MSDFKKWVPPKFDNDSELKAIKDIYGKTQYYNPKHVIGFLTGRSILRSDTMYLNVDLIILEGGREIHTREGVDIVGSHRKACKKYEETDERLA